MNPNNHRQPRRPQQSREKQQMPHESQEQEREIQVREDKTVVITTIDTVLTPEQTVNRYNTLAEQLLNIGKSIDAYRDKIEETLEEHGETLGALHTLVDDHPQDYPETVPEGEESVGFLSNQDLQRYHNLQEMDSQVDKMHEQIDEGLKDLEDIYPAARKMADNHGFELEDKPDEVRKEINS